MKETPATATSTAFVRIILCGALLADVPMGTHGDAGSAHAADAIATAVSSARALLAARRTAEAVATAIESGITIDCPATALQLHENVTFVLDSAAAGRLS